MAALALLLGFAGGPAVAGETGGAVLRAGIPLFASPLGNPRIAEDMGAGAEMRPAPAEVPGTTHGLVTIIGPREPERPAGAYGGQAGAAEGNAVDPAGATPPGILDSKADRPAQGGSGVVILVPGNAPDPAAVIESGPSPTAGGRSCAGTVVAAAGSAAQAGSSAERAIGGGTTMSVLQTEGCQ